jgi:hypothetical protein
MSPEVGERLVDLLELEVAAREGTPTPRSPARREPAENENFRALEGPATERSASRSPRSPTSAAAAARRADILAATRAAVERARAWVEHPQSVSAASTPPRARASSSASKPSPRSSPRRSPGGDGGRFADRDARRAREDEAHARRGGGRAEDEYAYAYEHTRRGDAVSASATPSRRSSSARDRRRRREEREREKGVEGFRAVGNAWRGVGRFLAGRR